MQEISGVKWRETEGPNEKDNDGNPFSVESSLKIQKEASDNRPEASVSYVSQMNM